VKHTNNIAWNRVASFPPFLDDANETTATYLQWAIPLANIDVNGTNPIAPSPTYRLIGRGASLALIDVCVSVRLLL